MYSFVWLQAGTRDDCNIHVISEFCPSSNFRIFLVLYCKVEQIAPLDKGALNYRAKLELSRCGVVRPMAFRRILCCHLNFKLLFLLRTVRLFEIQTISRSIYTAWEFTSIGRVCEGRAKFHPNLIKGFEVVNILQGNVSLE